VARDPFEVSPFEINDFLESLELDARRIPGVSFELPLSCQTEEKVFASSAGSYYTQRVYLTDGSQNKISLRWAEKGKEGTTSLECLTPAGLGFEYLIADRVPLVRERSLVEEIRRAVEQLKEDLLLPVKSVEVGRYDAVFDAPSVAVLADQTLGRATELDRALGYEANAGGTGYINDPIAMLGNYQAGASAVTLTGNRSEPGGSATVQWDDEGVVPDAFSLVKDGVLQDFQTTREAAGWLKTSYAKAGRPFRSHGCAAAPEAVDAPLLHTPNLVLQPGQQAQDFDALVAGLGAGIAIRRTFLDMDFQAVTGLGQGTTYEVKKGKRTAVIGGAGFLFRAPELWKGVMALGGSANARRFGTWVAKGQPTQATCHSVTAVSAVIKQLTLIDPLRKA
jgi:TldD protein